MTDSAAGAVDGVDVGRMTFVQHLAELRLRLIRAAVALVVATIACFSFAPQLFEWLRGPLASIPDQQMVVLSPLEMFITYLKLAVLAGVFLAAPYLLLQVWLFVSPGLYKHEKKWIVPFVVLGSIFFIGGGAFAFYVVLPMGFAYLVAMVPETVQANYSVAAYFAIVMRLLLAFGLVFELPLAMWIIAAAGVIRADTMARFRKYWIIIATVLGALLTPPDPLTQVMMAVPLILFFEVGILGARLLGRRHPAARAR